MSSSPVLCTTMRMVVGFFVLLWVVVGVGGYVSGAVGEGPGGSGLTTAQAVYMMMQLVTAVGYGDITPQTDSGKVFTIFYVLGIEVLVSLLISEALDYYRRKTRSIESDDALSFLQADDSVAAEGAQQSCRELQPVLRAVAYFVTVVAAWSFFFIFACFPRQDGDPECEAKSPVDALYGGVITMTTIGFGDVTPGTEEGDIFATFMMFVGTLSYFNLVRAFTEAIQQLKHRVRLDRLAADELELADTNKDGQVDLYEFTCFILSRFDIVSPDVLSAIKHNFQELDADGNGFLDSDDLVMLCERERQRQASRYTSRTSSASSARESSREVRKSSGYEKMELAS